MVALTDTVEHAPDGHVTFVAGLGHATACAVDVEHRPRPARFIWHHVLPQTCGGRTVAANLAALCDNCHYAVHGLLWTLAHGQPIPAHTSPGRVTLAQRGYAAAVAAGTVAKIPNEGGTVAAG